MLCFDFELFDTRKMADINTCSLKCPMSNIFWTTSLAFQGWFSSRNINLCAWLRSFMMSTSVISDTFRELPIHLTILDFDLWYEKKLHFGTAVDWKEVPLLILPHDASVSVAGKRSENGYPRFSRIPLSPSYLIKTQHNITPC